MRVIHFIPGLGNGGAEHMLYNILKYKTSSELEYSLITLGTGDYYLNDIQNLGIEVYVCDIKKNPIGSFFKLVRKMKKADVLCCWMYHCNFIGLLLGKLAGVKKVIWCIRHSDLSKGANKRLTLLINTMCARLSGLADGILYNGEKSRKVHENVGYKSETGYVIDNGCDTEHYKKVNNARQLLENEIRNSLQNKKVIISVARYHKIKDIPTFLESFTEISHKYHNVVAIMCGTKVDQSNQELIDLIEARKLVIGKDVFLMGERSDLPNIMSAADIYILHSLAEAFPNTLIEAMSCEAICISTDVGDVKHILDHNYIVNVGDSAAIAKKADHIFQLSDEEQQNICLRNRSIITDRYSIRNVVKNYESYYKR